MRRTAAVAKLVLQFVHRSAFPCKKMGRDFYILMLRKRSASNVIFVKKRVL